MKNILVSRKENRSGRRQRRKRVLSFLTAMTMLISTGQPMMISAEAPERKLICGMAEHVHGGDCYEKAATLICGQDEYAGHTHSAECKQQNRTLICGQDEYAGHTHGGDCYKNEKELTCGQQEGEEHAHGDGCYTAKSVLICTTAESAGHSHSDGCYQTEEIIVCGQQESAGHTHGEGCYTYEDKLSCTASEHTHSDSCYKVVETEKQTEAVTEKQTEAVTEKQTEKQTETVTEKQTEAETTAVTEKTTETESEKVTEAEKKEETEKKRDGKPVDLGKYIEKASIERRRAGSNDEWEKLAETIRQFTEVPLEIKEGDEIRFTLQYKLPGNVLEETTAAEYKLPLEHKEVKAQDKKKTEPAFALDKETEIGKIVTNKKEKVTITFKDSYLERNDDGQTIEGRYLFTVDADQLDFDENGNAVVKFQKEKNTEEKIRLDFHMEKEAEETAVTEITTEVESEEITELESEAESEETTELETEVESELESESETEFESELESESETESESELESETELETEVESETEIAVPESIAESVELINEVTTADGSVTIVKAQVPKGAFEAKAENISMEVSVPAEYESVKEVLKGSLGGNAYLEESEVYQIRFFVNGEAQEPAKPVLISLANTGMNVQECKDVTVFRYEGGTATELNETTGLNAAYETAQAVLAAWEEEVEAQKKAAKAAETTVAETLVGIDPAEISSTEQKEKEPEIKFQEPAEATVPGNLAEITVQEDGTVREIFMTVNGSGIYGCYTENVSAAATFTQIVDDVTVILEAPEGAFPVDASQVSMTADPLTEEQRAALEAELQAVMAEEEMRLDSYVAYDINLWVNGEIIQPQVPVTVTYIEPEKTEEVIEGTIVDAEGNELSEIPEKDYGFQISTETNELNEIPQVENADGSTALVAEHFTITVKATGKSADSSIIKDRLDGDYAYLRDVQIKDLGSGKKAISTGTAPFDGDDAAGNDSTADNMIVRSFDTIAYTVEFYTNLREEVKEQNISGYKNGKVFFEFILPYTSEEAQFNLDGMLWLQSSQEIEYELTKTSDGKQVLRGSYLLVPGNENPAAIGASQNELNISVRVLKMHNGDKVQPTFTLWLEHNNVGTTYKNGKAHENAIPETIVTGSGKTCATVDTNKVTHGQEYQTVTAPVITVSAAPLYNVAMVASTSSQNTKVGYYDFNKGDTTAINYGKGEVYGRLTGSGIRIEIDGKDGQGMRGVELPSEEKPITFTLSMSSYYDPTSGDPNSSINKNYQPMFYSGGGNSESATGVEGRVTDIYRNVVLMVPYNTLNKSKPFSSCYNGGNWSFKQINSSTIEITVSGIDINSDINSQPIDSYPQTHSDGTINNTLYYNPENITKWWEIEQAVFSAGEVWILQPYNSTDGKDTYIVDAYNKKEGQFYTTLELSGIKMYSETNTQAADTNANDNKIKNGVYLKKPGSIDGYIAYLRGDWTNYDSWLTEGAGNNDSDWATAGQNIAIRSHIAYNGNDGEYLAVGFDNLIKFDDEFFEPSGVYIGNQGYMINGQASFTIYWAGKKGGWTSDEDMKSATIDDLVYFKTSMRSTSGLTKLKAAGYECVGALIEWRGVQAPGAHNVMAFVNGKIKEDCEPNQVYMTTRSSYCWRMLDVQEKVEKYYNKKTLTDQDYVDYMKNVFPSKGKGSKYNLSNGEFTNASDYVKPFWRQDYYYTSTASGKGDGIATCRKASYNADGYQPGYGAKYYQDSCLVVPHKTSIVKSVAQKEMGSDTPKRVYDMDQGQRTVDYVLYPKIERAVGIGTSTAGELSTVIYIEDTLPKGVTYINGSAYLGGTYVQDNLHRVQGTVTGGIKEGKTVPDTGNYLLQEALTVNADGTTTIRWSFPISMNANDTIWTEPIYFSCKIGTPGDETTDVKNQQGLTNTVTIWSKGELKREFKPSNGNMAQYGIQIFKSGSLSLAKLADQLVVDWDTPIGFTMNVGNNSSTPKTNAVIVETLPYNGLNGTNFHGALKVTEFSAGTITNDSDSDALLSNLEFYYTMDKTYKGMTSEELIAAGVDIRSWNRLTLSSTANTESGKPFGLFQTADGKAFPSGVDQSEGQIISIAALGTLPANKTLKMHITFELPNGQVSDVLVNTLSQQSLVSSAKTTVINRVLEGLTWKDANGDGYQDSGEEMISGVKVSLWKLEGSEYVPYCYKGTTTQVTVETGKQISVQAKSGAEATDYEAGRYKFSDLPAGTFAVKFEDGTTSIERYIASPANVGTNDEKDSDGVPVYSADKLKLQETMIKGIVFQEAKEITSGTGEQKYYDSGFYDRGPMLPLTGGTGTIPYTVGGLLTMLAAGLTLMYNVKKRRKEDLASS